MSVADLDVTVHEKVAELIAVYACYAIDDHDEVDLVERHLSDCAVCRADLDEALAALATLSGPDTEPGEHVWLGIAAATGGLDAFDEAGVGGVVDTELEVATTSVWSRINMALQQDVPLVPDEIVLTRRWIRFFVVSAITAVALLLALIAGQDAELDQVRNTNAADTEQLAALDAMIDPTSTEVAFAWTADTTGDTDVAPLTAIVRGDQGWLVRSNLDALDDGVYQLWFDVDGTLRPVAVLGAAVEVTSFGIDPAADALVVTIEGSDGATTQVARGDLDGRDATAGS